MILKMYETKNESLFETHIRNLTEYIYRFKIIPINVSTFSNNYKLKIAPNSLMHFILQNKATRK